MTNLTSQQCQNLFKNALSSNNGIFREPNHGADNSSVDEKLTLLETKDVQNYVLYDFLNVSGKLVSNTKVSYKMEINFIDKQNSISSKIFLIDRTSNEILKESDEHKANNTNNITWNDSFDVRDIPEEKIKNTAIASVTELNSNAKSNSLTITNTSLLATPLPENSYTHYHPKKNQPPIELTKQSYHTAKYPTKVVDDKHIIVALYREPEITDDADYICEFGNKNGKPYFGVPGQGEIVLPMGTVVDGKNINAYAIVEEIASSGQKTGGVYSLTNTKEGMNFSINNNIVSYDFKGVWQNAKGEQEIYTKDGDWKKTYFNYQFIMWIPDEKGKQLYALCVSSDDNADEEDYSVFKKILTLGIMYGCLAEGTIVKTSKGEKKIEDISLGDELYNPFSGKYAKVCNKWTGKEFERLHTIRAGGKEITSTYNHPFFTPNGVYRAEDLRKGDNIYIGDLETAVIESIEINDKETNIYNVDLDTSDKHCFLANGFCSGDNGLQNMTGKKERK